MEKGASKLYRISIIILFLISLTLWVLPVIFANEVIWQKTFGTPLWDKGYALAEAQDGGIVFVGTANRDISGTSRDNDEYVWVIKTDNSGNHLWNKTFPGVIKTWGMGIIATNDNGFAFATSRGSGFWLVKIDSNGDKQWERDYQGYGKGDLPFSMIQTSDGGFAMLGRNPKEWNFYLTKTDSNGWEQWSKSYGGDYIEQGYSVVEDTDGGYSLVGRTRSFGIGNTDDVWIIKTDGSGNKLWDKTFGTSDPSESGHGHIQDSNNNYLISATPDMWLIKTDNSGNHLWNKTIEGAWGHGIGKGVINTFDSGYAVTGQINSNMAIVKLGSDGNEEWKFIVDGEDGSSGRSIIQTSDGSYVIVGVIGTGPVEPCLTCDLFIAKVGVPTALQITDIIPIQVVEGVDLVKDKSGIVRVVVKKNSPDDIRAKVKLSFDGEQVDDEKEVILNEEINNIDFIFKPDREGTNLKLKAEVAEL
ncbi:MAG: hypothetical protein L6408_05750 [Nanoarchaeota archaeon]|nr:hypothetical protein [Nanoarchaeota archaeon]